MDIRVQLWGMAVWVLWQMPLHTELLLVYRTAMVLAIATETLCNPRYTGSKKVFKAKAYDKHGEINSKAILSYAYDFIIY